MKFTMFALGPGLLLIVAGVLLDSGYPDQQFSPVFGLFGSVWCWFGLFAVMLYWTARLVRRH